VDDEPMLLELAERVLSTVECELRTFTNPATALREYTDAEKRPDLIITDFAMHEMDGMDLIRACRRLNPKQKIIMVSGTVDESIFADAADRPNFFLAKPYQPADLAVLVQKLLGD
jgi:CheY-like chemotaxis protein